MMADLEENFNLKIVRNQVFAALVASYLIVGHGANIGWFSSELPVLLSNSTPLVSGPLTYDELSWVGSMSSLGAIIGTFLTGLLSMSYGSKKTIVFLAFPVIIFWIFIHFGDTFYHILLARLITGITGGGFTSGIIYFISEIANDNIRGRLNSLVPLARNVGVLLAYIIGALIKYEDIPFVFILFPISYMILVFFLPNTPQYHLKINDFEGAEKSLMYYKGCTGKTDREKLFLKTEFERIKLLEEDRKNSPTIEFSDFCNWMALKGTATCIAISWFSQMTVIMYYASLIFKISDSIFSIDVSAIILACIQIGGGLISTQLGDAFGRKITLFISLFGSALGLFIFSAYLYFHHHRYEVSNFMWLPVVCLSLVMFISTAGILALGHTIVIENFPPKIRPIGMAFYSIINALVTFVVGKSFPILLEIIYLHGFILILAINCCFGLIVVHFMKETKGLSLDIPEHV